MKCPMLTMYATTFKKPEEFKDRDCLKEKCAWWIFETKNCALLSLTLWVGDLQVALGKIADKMPQEKGS